MKKWNYVSLGAISLLTLVLVTFLLISFLSSPISNEVATIDDSVEKPDWQAERLASIPQASVKQTPLTDKHPPLLHSSEFETPIALNGPINTSGVEDSAYISTDGKTIYFFFTPDATAAATTQVSDGVSGIYFSEYLNGIWNSPQKLLLSDPDTNSLDGCPTILENSMLFCSAREGYVGLNWFIATFTAPDTLVNWTKLEFEPYELHLTPDQSTLYLGADKPEGKGNSDIWVTQLKTTISEPKNVDIVNTPESESQPFITPDGTELWYTGTYMGSPAVYRSKLEAGSWQPPQLIVSQFCGEPSLDSAGNLYFTHIFYNEGIVESDIYVAYLRE